MHTPELHLSHIEQTLSHQGCFSLLDWCISENYLSYSDYETWRHGESKTLDSALKLNKKAIESLIKTADKICQSLRLAKQEQDYHTWKNDSNVPLKLSLNSKVHQGLSIRWLRPQDLPQMDLFMDNAGVIAENDTIKALGMRDFIGAQQCINRLSELNPNNDKIGRYQDLINYGQHMDSGHIEEAHLLAELEGLEKEVVPLARDVLKHEARDYLSFAWRRISHNLIHTGFDQAQPKLHQSFTLMQIPDWRGALDTLKQEKSLFNSSELLIRLARCYENLLMESEALYVWCLLMEHDPVQCEAAIEQKYSPAVSQLWQEFWEINDSGACDFFPAYIIASRPGLVHRTQHLPALTTSANKAVLSGVLARLNNEEDINARKAMQSVSPALLRLYLDAIAIPHTLTN